jgi:hypothetical protein
MIARSSDASTSPVIFNGFLSRAGIIRASVRS